VGRNLSISSFNKLPIAFLNSILLFFIILSVVVELEAFWHFCYLFSNPSADDSIRLEAQLKAIIYTDEGKRIFLTGSSQAREDFNLKYLNNEFKEAGATLYNLGVSGAAQPIELFMIKDRLLGKKPDIVIYVPFVGSFYSKYDFGSMRYYFDPRVIPYMLKHLGVGTLIANREYFFDSFLGKLWIPYKYRDSIRGIFKTAAKHYMNLERRTEAKMYAYVSNKPQSYFENQIREAKQNRYLNTQYTALNKDLFTESACDIIKSGVELIVISGPTHPLIHELYKEEIDLSFDTFLLDKANEIGFVYLSENELPPFTEADFIDFTHLNALGRHKLSRFLSTYIRENVYLMEE